MSAVASPIASNTFSVTLERTWKNGKERKPLVLASKIQNRDGAIADAATIALARSAEHQGGRLVVRDGDGNLVESFTIPEEPRTFTPEELERFRRADGNRLILQIVAAIDEAKSLSKQFLKEHPEGCGCEFCAQCDQSEIENSAFVRRELSGYVYVLECLPGSLRFVARD